MILQSRINKWQRKTFQKSTVYSKMKHLRKEMEELDEAIVLAPVNMEALAMELADCVFLLFGIAGLFKINLLKAVKRKFKINKKRKWGLPDKDGVYLHKKEDEKENDTTPDCFKCEFYDKCSGYPKLPRRVNCLGTISRTGFKLHERFKCPACGGSGDYASGSMGSCGKCDGTGKK